MTTTAGLGGTVDDYVTHRLQSIPETDWPNSCKKARRNAPLNTPRSTRSRLTPLWTGLDLEMGDIVGARDRLTGMAGTAVIRGQDINDERGRNKLRKRG